MYRIPELKIEIKSGMDMREIHSLLAVALEFPDYYGRNWDAFEECINDDDASNPPVQLIIQGWDHLIREHLRDAQLLWSCIVERNDSKKPTEVLVTPRACPCCSYLTLSDCFSGSWEMCSVCNWEDDDVQFRNPDYEVGANRESLNQARAKFVGKQAETKYVRDFRATLS